VNDKQRFYAGSPDEQPQDCGRTHPQPTCACVLCEIAERFASIEAKERELARVKKLRAELGVP
jgi:hypothetical protein